MFSLPPAHSVNRVFLGGRGMLLRFRALTVGWTTYVCMNLAEATRENRRTTETYVVEYFLHDFGRVRRNAGVIAVLNGCLEVDY